MIETTYFIDSIINTLDFSYVVKKILKRISQKAVVKKKKNSPIVDKMYHVSFSHILCLSVLVLLIFVSSD